MRYLIVLLLAGCASPGPAQVDAFDTASKDPVCARQCLESNALCMTSIRGTSNNRLIANDIIQTCNANARQCLSTCPTR